MNYGWSTFLVAVPSWSSGAARVLDIGGTFDEYNRAGTDAESTAIMLAADWLALADDFRATAREHAAEAAQLVP